MGFFSNLLSAVGNVAAGVTSAIPGVGTVVGGANGLLQSVLGTDPNSQAQKQQQREMNWSSGEAEKNRAFQREERLQTQEYNEMMWNKANEYNSPVEQMKRASEAGINPNDVVSGGNHMPTAGVVTSSPQSGSIAPFPGSIAEASALLDAQYSSILANTENMNARTRNEEYTLTWNTATEAERMRSLKLDNMVKDASYQKILKDCNIADVELETQKQALSYFSRFKEEELRILQEQVNNWRNKNLEILQNIKESKSREKLNYENAELADQQTYESIARTSNLEQEGVILQNQADITGNEAEISRVKKEFSTLMDMPVDTPEYMMSWKIALHGGFGNYVNYIVHRANEGLVTLPSTIVGKFINPSASAPRATYSPRLR